MPLRLNRNQLLELIGSIEAGGGDATVLRRELEDLGPGQNYRVRGHRPRLNEEEELTTADRLNNRVGDLFSNGVSDELLDTIIEIDRSHSLKELRDMCIEAGLSTSGDKKELAAKLIAKGAPGTKMPQTITPPQGRCYEDAWRFVIREGEGELVHGSVQTIGKRINHAWVETETAYLWEPESGQFMKKAYFYERSEPKVEARYTVEEAAIMVARTKHFGPWSAEETKGVL